jgi:DNA-binding transcriptional MerR regulator
MRKKPATPKEMTSLTQTLPNEKGSGKQYFTVPELIRLTGMSRKQVNYWDRIGLLTPTMKNPGRAVGKASSFYSPQDVLRALVICDMKHRGISLQQIQQVARNLEREGIRLDESSKYLLTDGFSVYYAKSDTEVIDILIHNRQMILIPIHDQVEKLRKAA